MSHTHGEWLDRIRGCKREEKSMRLIDSDELDKAKYHPLPYTHITPSNVDAESYMRGWNDAIDAIMSDAPIIEERKTGKWGEHGECPFCSYLRQWEDDKFCGSCGASMMEGEQPC